MAHSSIYTTELYFWTRENPKANAEVDLCLAHNNKVIPVEIKSGSKGRLRSLHEFMDRSQLTYAFRLLANRYSVQNAQTTKGKTFQLYNMPYFLAGK